MFVVMPGRSCCVCVHRVAAYRTSSQPPTVQHSQGAQLHRAWHTSLTELKLQTNNIEAISGPNQFSPARFIQFRYFEKYYVVSHSALWHMYYKTFSSSCEDWLLTVSLVKVSNLLGRKVGQKVESHLHLDPTIVPDRTSPVVSFMRII